MKAESDFSEEQPTLRDRRILLRPWAPGDVDSVFAACQDIEIQRWTTVPQPYLRQHAQDFIDAAPRAWMSQSSALFALQEARTSELAGSVGVLQFHQGVAALGYWTSPWARGRDLMSEAVGVLARWCVRDRECARVELSIEDTNLASRRVAVKAGFHEEGVLRQRMLHRSRRIDVVMYSLLAEEIASL